MVMVMDSYPRLSDHHCVAIDTETTGLRWWVDRIFAISLSTPDGADYFWDIRDNPGAVEWAREEFPRIKRPVFHNAKFDIHMLREIGVSMGDLTRVEDTMVRAALLDEHLVSYELDYLGQKYLGKGKDTDIWEELAAMFGGRPTKRAQIVNLKKAPSSLVARYAKRDTRLTMELFQYQEPKIEAEDLNRVLAMEKDLLPVLVDMEHRGVRVNIGEAEKAVQRIDSGVGQMQHELDGLAGFPVNPNPSGSIHKLFKPKKNKDGAWVLVDGTVAPETESGAPSISADVLRRMKHPAADVILRMRKMIRTRDTFLKGHILGHHHNGVIHANFNQTRSDNDAGTSTGRLSVNSPALQQIHKRDKDIAAIVRSLFLPDEGDYWACGDWAQMDFRVFAHYTSDPRIIRVYANDPDADFHQIISDLIGMPRSPRYAGDPNAKQINLGMVFGMSQGRLAAEMGLPHTVESIQFRDEDKPRQVLRAGEEAEEVFKKYHESIPGIRSLLRKATSVARSRGYVKTATGRRIRFPGGFATHKAGGLVFQGTAADALKIKLVEVWRYFNNVGRGRLLLNVHDEFDTSIPRDAAGEMGKDLKEIVETFDGERCPIRFRVPIRSKWEMGENWWEAS